MKSPFAFGLKFAPWLLSIFLIKNIYHQMLFLRNLRNSLAPRNNEHLQGD